MFKLKDYAECNISSITEGIRAFTQGMPSGYFISNDLLKVSGGHNSRTAQKFYDIAESDYLTDQVASLELERLISQLNIIGSERELISGLILLMSSGLLLGHWKKFVFDTNVGLSKYRDIFCAQWEFEKGVDKAFISDAKAEPLRVQFNAMHDRINGIIRSYFSKLEDEVNILFDELFVFIGSRCNFPRDQYDKLRDNRLQLLLRDGGSNQYQQLLNSIVGTSDNPTEVWNTFLDYKGRINSLGSPTKDELYKLFGVAKKTMQTYQPKFIQHIQRGFGDDFTEIINKLDLEVN